MNALTVTNLADDILLFQLVGMYGMLDEHYQTILLVFQKITASSLQLLQSSKSFFFLSFSVVVVITESSTFNRRLCDRMMYCSTLQPDWLVLEAAGHGFHIA